MIELILKIKIYLFGLKVKKNVFIVVHSSNWLLDKEFNRIHESKSSLKAETKYNLIFSKITLKRLPHPYQTDCFPYPDSTSQKQSIKDCVRHQMKNFLNCLHFDSIIVFNSSDDEYKICNLKHQKWFKYKENFTKICNKQFRPDCNVKFYEFEVIKMREQEFDERKQYPLTYVYLFPKSSDEMVYIYSPRMTIIDFIGNLGGIFSLWLGMSFISLFD